MLDEGSSTVPRYAETARVGRDLSLTDRVIRVFGGTLNLLALGTAVSIFAQHLQAALHPTLIVILLLAFVVGTFAADLVTGLLHWAFDTWFSPHNGIFRRMVAIVRDHHVRPHGIFSFRFGTDMGVLSWFGAIGAFVLLLVTQPLASSDSLVCGFSFSAIVFSVNVSLMYEHHKWGHRRERGPIARIAQRLGLLLSPDHHLQHHRGTHDSHYCLVNGMADRTLGSVGLFRGLERVITAMTGVVPRADDHATLARVGQHS
jgi:ubiquitin-conjugating enzyme E2 variant